MLSPVFLEIVPRAGCSIEDVFSKAKALAVNLGVIVRFSFNGTVFQAHSATTLEATLEAHGWVRRLHDTNK